MFVTPYNYDASDELCFEHNPGNPSLTVPDEALSLRDLLANYTHGIAPPVSQTTYYDSDFNDGLTFDDVDPTLDPDFDLADYSSLLSDLAASTVPSENVVPPTKEDGLKKELEVDLSNEAEKVERSDTDKDSVP